MSSDIVLVGFELLMLIFQICKTEQDQLKLVQTPTESVNVK